MNITNTNQIENHHVFNLTIGSSGIGKTSLAKTLPHNETLIISAESGLLSIKDVSIDVVVIKTWSDLIQVYVELVEGTKYKHVFIDSLTEIAQILFTELKPDYSKAQTFGLYDEYSTKMMNFLRKMRDLSDYNFWITCLDKIEKKYEVDVVSINLIQRSLTKNILPLFDEVFYYDSVIKDDKTVRYLLTENNTQIDFAKDRSGKLDQYEKPNLGDIYNKIFNS